ncbi:MAG TPA: urease accessory UreF family protein [Verrucomicrobiae bacterium]|nr:urease accessory UreF family protein [Verrucomicrobiae bacterium]
MDGSHDLRVIPPLADTGGAVAEWLVWQLADSAFPTGGFAHSGGVEAAWQHGEIRNRVELARFVEASLWQAGRASLPLVTVAHREPARLAEWDALNEAFLTGHVANRASRLQGQALWLAVERIFTQNARRDSAAAKPPRCHFAPVFGALTRELGLDSGAVTRLFLFQHSRALLASAVRLGIVGPMEAQSLQYRLGETAAEVLAKCSELAVEDLAQTAPLLEIWQSGQDRLYSRLFQS